MAILKFTRRLFSEQPLRLFSVVATLTIASLFEGAAIALLIPLLTSIGQASQSEGASGFILNATNRMFSVLHLPLTITSILGFIFVLGGFQQAFTLLQQKLLFGALHRFQARLRENLYGAIFEAGWPFFVKHKAGNLTNALTAEVTRAGEAFRLLGFVWMESIVILVYLGVALLLSWQMTLATALVGAALALALKGRMSRATQYGKSITQANSDLQNEATEQINGAKLVKSSAVEHSTIAQFNKYLNSIAESYFQTNLNQAWIKALYDLAALGVLCLGIFAAVTYFKMPIANLLVFLFVFYRLAPRLSNTQSFIYGTMDYLPSLDQIDRLREEAMSMKEKTGATKISDVKREVALNSVNFAYNPDHQIIKDVTLKINAGQTTAIIGGSGAGKSTIIDLIMGLLSPDAGEIAVDGTPLVELNLKDWRRLIGYVPQETVLFHTSVKDNIKLGLTDLTDEEIMAAAKMAYADEFIQGLPQGYDTLVGDKGVRLSGGQRQRVALARALARKPKLLILDEATNALDADSERKIQAAVEALAKSMTILIVTHRLATVRNVDMIYVLEEGRVIEGGRWDELQQAGGRFADLAQMQEL